MSEANTDYRISYLTRGFQKLVLIENGGSYAFVNCPEKGRYWCVENKDLGRIKERMMENNVIPIIISEGETRFLIEKIISNISFSKDRPRFSSSLTDDLLKLENLISG